MFLKTVIVTPKRGGDFNLLHTSRFFVNLNTRLPQKRFRLLKGAQEIASLENNST